MSPPSRPTLLRFSGRKPPKSFSGWLKTLAFHPSAPRKVGQDARAFRETRKHLAGSGGPDSTGVISGNSSATTGCKRAPAFPADTDDRDRWRSSCTRPHNSSADTRHTGNGRAGSSRGCYKSGPTDTRRPADRPLVAAPESLRRTETH